MGYMYPKINRPGGRLIFSIYFLWAHNYTKQMTSEEDIKLMQRIASADEDALSILMNRHIHQVIRLAEKILGSLTEAEDIAQEVFMKIWKAAPNWTPEASLKTWIYRITFNRCLDLKRRVKYKLDLLEETSLEHAQKDVSEEAAAVKEAVKLLSLKERTAVVLHHYEGYSQKEAADIMGVSLRTFERAIAAATENLKTIVQKHCAVQIS